MLRYTERRGCVPGELAALAREEFVPGQPYSNDLAGVSYSRSDGRVTLAVPAAKIDFVIAARADCTGGPAGAAAGQGQFLATHDLVQRFPSGVEGKTHVRLIADAAGNGPAYSEREWNAHATTARWQRRNGAWLLDGSTNYKGAVLDAKPLP